LQCRRAYCPLARCDRLEPEGAPIRVRCSERAFDPYIEVVVEYDDENNIARLRQRAAGMKRLTPSRRGGIDCTTERTRAQRVTEEGELIERRRVLALALPGRVLSEVAPLLVVLRQVNAQVGYSDERIAAVLRQNSARLAWRTCVSS
jgi:hypothetical protein